MLAKKYVTCKDIIGCCTAYTAMFRYRRLRNPDAGRNFGDGRTPRVTFTVFYCDCMTSASTAEPVTP